MIFHKKETEVSGQTCPNSVEDNIAMAGSTTASTTSFNSKKGPSTVPVRRNGVKIGPATLNEVKQNIKTKATAPLKDFVPRSSHQPSSYLLAFSQPSIGVKKSALSTNVQSRFASAVVDGVLEPQRLARHI